MNSTTSHSGAGPRWLELPNNAYHPKILSGLCFLITICYFGLYSRREKGLPPGPPTLPLIGNLHQIPATGIYKSFVTWSEKYGSVFTLKLGASNAVVLCDRKSVHELLDKKGNIYSDRPNSFMNSLLGVQENIFMLPMDDIWKEKRKIVSHNLSPAQLDKKHWRVQEAEATLLLNDLLESPKDYDKHIRRYTASIIHVLVHGFRAKTYSDWWGHAVYKVMELRTFVLEPGSKPPIDEFPIFELFSRFFGAWYKKAEASRQTTQDIWTECRKRVDDRRAHGDKRDCMADTFIDQFEATRWPIGQTSFNQLLGEMVEGGADTSAAGLRTLILAFVTHPEVQKRARAEIDAACGTERSPKWTDFEKIPYVNTIVKEGLRWRPVAPTGLPHRLRQDDHYDGMLIPKDATIFVGIWALHHNAEYYKEPNSFNPDRFAKHDKLASYYAGSGDYNQRDHYAYGAGRRICPGMHLAERNLWRTAAKLLWAFEFLEASDADGSSIHLDIEAYTDGLTREPKPFLLHIKPRSAEHIATIKRELQDAEEVLKLFE